MPTPTDIFGFEYGAVLSVQGGGLYSAIVGLPTVAAGTVVSGNYALRVPMGEPNNITLKVQPSTTTFVGCVHFRFDTMPSGADLRFMEIINETVLDCWFEVVLATGFIRASFEGNGAQSTSVQLQQNQWHTIEWKVVLSADPTTLDWSYDGVQQTQVTRTGTGTNVGGIKIGDMSAAGTGNIFFDDVIYSITSADFMTLSIIKVEGLVPNADGTHNNTTNVLENFSGADIDGVTVFAYQQLNDMPWTTTLGDRIQSNLAGATRYVEMVFPNVSGTSIYAVKGYLEYAAGGTAGNTGATIIRLADTTEYSIYGTAAAPADMSESSAFFKTNVLGPPGGGWTQTIVNGLVMRVGYSDDANPDPYWLVAMLEYAYASGDTFSDTFSLARSLGINNTILTTHNPSVSFAKSIDVLVSVLGTYGHLLSLGRTLDATTAPELLISSTLSLARLLDISSSSMLSYEALFALSRSLSLTSSSQLDAQDLVSLGKSLEISTSAEAIFVATLSLTKSIDILLSSTGDFQLTLSLARNLIITTLSEVQGVIEETLLLSRSIAINNAAALAAVGDILLSKSIGLTLDPGANLSSNLSLNKSIALSVSAAFLISDAITLNRSHNVAISKELFINQSIGLDKSLGISSSTVLELSEQLLLGRSVTIFDVAILSINTDVILGKVLSISIIGGLDYSSDFALNLSRAISLASQVVMFVGDLPAEIIVGDSSVWTMNIADILVD